MPQAALMRFGYASGKLQCWCAACNREFLGGTVARGQRLVPAFNCERCAQHKAASVEQDCSEAGLVDE